MVQIIYYTGLSCIVAVREHNSRVFPLGESVPIQMGNYVMYLMETRTEDMQLLDMNASNV